MKRVQRVPDLRSQIYERLRSAIRRGTYPPGKRLLENEIARDLGVSRTPAREALAMLTHEGILINEGRGFKLPVYDAQQITEVFEIRQRLEPYAVRLICERATASELKALRVMADSELGKHSSAEAYAAANLRLREELFALSKNRRLEETIHLYDELVHFVRLKTLTVEANRELSIKGWRNLIGAVVLRKADVAESAMSHLLEVAQHLVLDATEKNALAETSSSRVKQ